MFPLFEPSEIKIVPQAAASPQRKIVLDSSYRCIHQDKLDAHFFWTDWKASEPWVLKYSQLVDPTHEFLIGHCHTDSKYATYIVHVDKFNMFGWQNREMIQRTKVQS